MVQLKPPYRHKAVAETHKKIKPMKITTFLTFVGDQCGKAKEAMDFYTSLFPNSEIKSVTHYAKGEPGGTPELIKYGVFHPK